MTKATTDAYGNEVETGTQTMADTSKPMTIGDAKKIFGSFGDYLIDDQESLVKIFRESKVQSAIANSNYLHALTLTRIMMDHADHSFLMVTGNAGDGFLKCLKDAFNKMARRIAKASGRIQILFLLDDDEADPSLAGLDTDRVKTKKFRFRGQSDIGHFIVCDDDMVRDEYIHESFADEKQADLIKADVFFSNKAKAKAFTLKFDTLWGT